VHRTTFCCSQNNGLPGNSTVNTFVRDGPVNDFVSHWRLLESNCYFRLFCNSWNLVQGVSKDLSNFVSGETTAS